MPACYILDMQQEKVLAKRIVDYTYICKTFLKIGSLSFGGWSTTALLIEKEFVEQGILQANGLKTAATYAQILPGATQVILVSHVGYTLKGVRGALAATVSYLLPSVTLMTVFAMLYFHYLRAVNIQQHIGGLIAALVGIMLANAYNIGKKHTTVQAWWLLALAAFTARLLLKVDALTIIVVAGLGALLLSFIQKRRSAS